MSTIEQPTSSQELSENGWSLTPEGRATRLIQEFGISDKEMREMMDCGLYTVHGLIRAELSDGRAPKIGKRSLNRLNQAVTFADGLTYGFSAEEVGQIFRFRNFPGLDGQSPQQCISSGEHRTKLEELPTQLVEARRNS